MRPDLEGIRKRAEAATKGPWREGTLNVWNDSLLLCICSTERLTRKRDSRKKQQADSQFIAHARTDIPDLLAYIAKLEELEDAACIAHTAITVALEPAGDTPEEVKAQLKIAYDALDHALDEKHIASAEAEGGE